MTSKFKDKNIEFWEKTYSEGRQVNLYPYEEIVSTVFREYGRSLNGLKVLEIGCGAGNNLTFMAEHGAEVTGIDASPSAIKICTEIFRRKNLLGEFLVLDVSELSHLKQKYDVIIDRACLTTLSYSSVAFSFKQICKLLKKSGIVFTQIYSDKSSVKGRSENGRYTKIKGELSEYGSLSFFSLDEIIEITKGFKVKKLKHVEEKNYMPNTGSVFAYWNLTMTLDLAS